MTRMENVSTNVGFDQLRYDFCIKLILIPTDFRIFYPHDNISNKCNYYQN